MKKIIVLAAALLMVLSLTGCFGTTPSNSSTADQANAADVSTYAKDFEGLQKYITDRNNNTTKQELYYEIVGADNAARIVLNGNSFVEIYDYSKANNDTAKAILEDIKDDGKFRPMEDSTEMTAVITKSGKYVLAWDATRGFDYEKKVATEELKENW